MNVTNSITLASSTVGTIGTTSTTAAVTTPTTAASLATKAISTAVKNVTEIVTTVASTTVTTTQALNTTVSKIVTSAATTVRQAQVTGAGSNNGTSANGPSSVPVTSFWGELQTYMSFFGLMVPIWGLALAGIVILVAIIIIIVACCRSKQPAESGKTVKSTVVPLDTSHLLDYQGSVCSINVQPDGSEIELEHRSNSMTLREKRFIGSLKYSVLYDVSKNELKVDIHQASDLHLAVPDDAINPFCKVYLFPDKDKKSRFETPVENGSNNPVFNQTYCFNVPYSELLDKTLVLAVWNAGQASKPTIIGQLRIPIGAVDINNPIVEEWRDLEMVADVDDDASHGDVCISLRYVPTTTKLTAVVLECKNLRRKTDSMPKPCDSFVKLKLKQNGKVIKSKRTSVKKRTHNPYFNEEFTFLMPPDVIHKCQLIATVCIYEKVVGGRKIGKILLGSNVVGSGAQHWSEMVSSPRKPIVQWHRLESMIKFE